MNSRTTNWTPVADSRLVVGSYVARVGYARNGNAHRATEYRQWAVGVRREDGTVRVLGSMLKTRRAALALGAECIATGELA